MKYKKAKYIKLLQCPECHYYSTSENDNMSDKDDFQYKTDDKDKDYIECPCGCKFVR